MHQDATDSEVQRLLRPLSTKWVQAVASVSRDTVAGWRDGSQQPRPDRWEKLVEAVRQSLPENENAAPSEEGAAAELLRLWKGSVPADYEGGRLAAIEGFDDVVIFQGHTEVARYPMPGDAFDVAWTDAGLYVVIGDLNGKENPRDVLIRHGRLYTVPIDMPGLGMSATAVPDGGVIVGNGWLTSDGGFVLLQRMQHAARSGVDGHG